MRIERHRWARRAWGVACLLVCWATAAPAGAHHTEQEHLTDDTAWTMASDKAWRIGLFKAAVGFGNRVIVGSYTWPWLVFTPNAYAKWRFYAGETWHWAVQGGFFRLNGASFQPDAKDPPVFGVGNLSLLQSVRLGARHQLSNSLVFTGVRARGSVDSGTLRGAGEGGVTNFQYVGAYELRLSERTALVLTGRYLIAQVIDAKTGFTVNPDEFTTVDVHLNAEDDSVVNFRGAFSIVPAFAFSFNSFNLELGLGYGNFNVPGINFMINRRTLIPSFDLYWTF